jgi:hypothetical protein
MYAAIGKPDSPCCCAKRKGRHLLKTADRSDNAPDDLYALALIAGRLDTFFEYGHCALCDHHGLLYDDGEAYICWPNCQHPTPRDRIAWTNRGYPRPL